MNQSSDLNAKKPNYEDREEEPEGHEEEREREEEGRRQSEDFNTFEAFEDAPNDCPDQGHKNQAVDHREKQEQEEALKQSEQNQQRVNQKQQSVRLSAHEQQEQDQNEIQKSEQDQQISNQVNNNEASEQANEPKDIEQINKNNQKEPKDEGIKENAEEPNSDLPQQTSPLSLPQQKGHIIIKQAQKDRLADTYNIFLKYNIQYRKTVASYKLIIKNSHTELINKQNTKKELQSIILQYFDTSLKLNKEFYEKSYKLQKEQPSLSTNKLVNLKEDLKEGYEGLFYVRKSLADQMRKLQNYIVTYTIKSINQAFDTYQRLQNAEERRQSETVQLYLTSEKNLEKVFSTLEKLFKKGINGDKSKEDIFIWIVKFINQQKQYRQNLIKYGKTIIEFKKTYIIGEKDLFNTLQKILNEYKVQSRKVYAAKQQEFIFIDDYLIDIENKVLFEHLCTITDVDYIKSMLELQGRKDAIKFTDDHFIRYLDLPFFDQVVGNKKDLFKGAINKCFPLQQKNEELVHTISGNLVQYNRETDQCRQKFQIRNINVRLIGEGAIEMDEVIKGIVFSENRTVRLKLKDNDRAEELICYLNEKDQFNEKLRK